MNDWWFDIKNRVAFDALPPGVDYSAWVEYRSKLKLSEALIDPQHPIQIDVELNGGCNMHCPFCLHGYSKIENVLMPDEMFRSVVMQAVAIGVCSMKFNYINEPLLRRDLAQHIAFARAHGIVNAYLVTNGSLLKRNRREELLGCGLTRLFVSIDAATAETYNRQRLNGLYDTVTANIAAFIDERNAAGKQFPQVVVTFLQNALNINEREQFERQWSGVADVLSFQTMNEVPSQTTGLTLPRTGPEHGCKFVFKQLVVSHRGDIMPCCKLPGRELVIGNIATMTLAEAWARNAWMRRMHASDEWKAHDICSRCLKGC